jgi:hypothetical protein
MHPLAVIAFDGHPLNAARQSLEAIMSEYKSAAASLSRGLGTQQRAELQRLLESLDQDALEGALRIVVGQHPGLLRDGGPVELDVDLDELDALTLRLVQQYAQHAKSARPLLSSPSSHLSNACRPYTLENWLFFCRAARSRARNPFSLQLCFCGPWVCWIVVTRS